VIFSPLLHGHSVGDGEVDVVAAIERNLRMGGVFYDVGANIGIFSLLATTFVGAQGQIVAFEPEENNLACLRRTLANDFPNIKLYEIALGNADGVMHFDRRGGAFSGRLVVEGTAAFETVPVRVRSIDSLIAEGLPPPDLIKIDVEGGEGSVLEGAKNLLERGRCMVLCEMHTGNPGGVARAFAALNAAGYRINVLGNGDITEPLAAVTGTYHVLACPRPGPNWLSAL
jgi:FkbM family methyltransferase